MTAETSARRPDEQIIHFRMTAGESGCPAGWSGLFANPPENASEGGDTGGFCLYARFRSRFPCRIGEIEKLFKGGFDFPEVQG